MNSYEINRLELRSLIKLIKWGEVRLIYIVLYLHALTWFEFNTILRAANFLDSLRNRYEFNTKLKMLKLRGLKCIIVYHIVSVLSFIEL